jgi:hypothetical protein
LQGVKLLPNITTGCGMKNFGLQIHLSALDTFGINKKYGCNSTYGYLSTIFRQNIAILRNLENNNPPMEINLAVKICAFTVVAIMLLKKKNAFIPSKKVSF